MRWFVALLAAAALLVPTTAAARPTVEQPAAGAARTRTWAAADQATIRPGSQLVSATGQCTSNFIFTRGQDVFIGSAAHCTAEGSSTDGCTNTSLPIGSAVQIEGADHAGTLAYSSWATMQANDESDRDACAYNDFALVRIDPRDVGRVNPTMPSWGGPLGLSVGPQVGETVYTYGSSSTRGGMGSAKQGSVTGRGGGGWTYTVRTGANAGIPGDSGSGFIDAAGRGFGVLVTIELLPEAGSNGVSDLRMAMDYLADHTDLDGVLLEIATEPFGPTGEAPPPPPDDPGTQREIPIERVSGPDRYATAATIAARVGSADAVVVATGVQAPDALAAGPAAAALDAPLLLAGPSGMGEAALEQVERLAPDVAYIIGGTRAVPSTVEQQLTERGAGRVERIFGPDRYATAAEVATTFGTQGRPLVVAAGAGFADALAASPLAAAQGGMLLLVSPTAVPGPTRSVLQAFDPSAVQVVGGTAVISEAHRDQVSADAGVEAARIAGSDRYGTGAAVARSLLAADGFAFSGSVWAASGRAFPDALAGGPAIDRDRGVLLLVPSTGPVPDVVAETAAASEGTGVVVLGGEQAVSQATARSLADAVG